MQADRGLSHLVEAATALAGLAAQRKDGLMPQTADAELKTGADAVMVVSSDDEMRRRLSEHNGNSSQSAPSSKREIFPQRLMAVLHDASLSDIISWLPHGRSFVIIRPDVFTEKVMPQYFPPADARASCKYPSFTRKLNRWGFRQATRGADTGAFYHPLFQRDQPHLCLDMVCQRARDRKNGTKPAAVTPSPAKKESSRGPLKKRAAPAATSGQKVVATLTKEALDTICPPAPETPKRKGVSIVSMTDDAQSEDSQCSVSSSLGASNVQESAASVQSPPSSPTTAVGGNSVNVAIKRGVSSDQDFVQSALRQRDDMERMRLAKAMLYTAYMNAAQHS